MKKRIPEGLIWLRLLLGFVIIGLCILQPAGYRAASVVLLTIGLLSDIFDGIIARKLGISTTRLRRLDSSVDQVFFIAVAFATYWQCPEFFRKNGLQIGILIGLEALTYIVSFLKFRKEIATHSIGAKLWTLTLFGVLVQVLLKCDSGWLFQVCFWLGALTRLEILAIVLTLKKWTNDVPSLYHALRLRQGKEIKRNKMFNG